MLSITESLAYYTCDTWQARQRLSTSSANFHILSVIKEARTAHYQPSTTDSPPNFLEQFHKFSQSMLDARHDHPAKILVVCCGCDPEVATRCELLLGGFLIVCDGFSLDQVTEIFQPVVHRFVPFRYSSRSTDEVLVIDCWRALHRARLHGWIDFISGDIDVDRCIDMGEYLHYDSPANGAMHVLVPGALLAIACPRDLPGGATWSDVGGARRFSPAYYADIFADFGVRLVARCGGPSYDARALAESGTDVEDLVSDPSSAPEDDGENNDDYDDEESGPEALTFLSAADRLLTLARAVPGAIAMHGAGPGGSLGAGGRILAETYLIRRHGFGGPDALAWLLIAHPPPGPRAAEAFPAPPPGRDDLSAARSLGAGRRAGRGRLAELGLEVGEGSGDGGWGWGGLSRAASSPCGTEGWRGVGGGEQLASA